MPGTVQRKLWNTRVSFRISEECLGLNETKRNVWAFIKGEMGDGTNWKTEMDTKV